MATREENIMNARSHHHHLRERREAALTRRLEWANLTPSQQLRILTERVGTTGAAKQRKRIIEQLIREDLN